MKDRKLAMLSDEELDTLDDRLLGQTDDDGMLLSEFDGFCAGLIVCPQMILPAEWLPRVWGDGEARFETVDQAEGVTTLLIRHYNNVAQSLSAPGVEYAPIYDEDRRTGEVLWESWCHGFEQAMRLRPDTWAQIVESGVEEAAASVNMMIALADIAEGRSDLPQTSIDALTDEAPEIIPHLVVTLNGWTKSQSPATPVPAWSAANRPNAPYQRAKVGRNAPCPCGSGRKYKRCCGGN